MRKEGIVRQASSANRWSPWPGARSDRPSAILVSSPTSHGISFAIAAGSASSAIALTMSIGSKSATASVASDIISVALADLFVLMPSPAAPYAARPETGPPSLISPR